MIHTLFGTGPLMAPFGRLLRHLHFAPFAGGPVVPPLQARQRASVAARGAIRPAQGLVAARAAAAVQPRRAAPTALRVVRVMESGQAPALTGRLRMSGRLDEVCAELDRMVARESAAHPIT